MTFEEAVEVLQTIRELYPKHFEITRRKVNILIPQLEKMDYAPVMEKLSSYAANHPFPPTLADIAVYPPEKNVYLEKMRAWEQEAADVPRETKLAFDQQLAELLRGMADDSQ